MAQSATAPEQPGGAGAPPDQGALIPPHVLLGQIRTIYPEYHDIDDQTLLSKMLTKHPDWRKGVPKDARSQGVTEATGANKATGITGPRTWGESFRENLPTIGMTVGGVLRGVPGAALGGAAGEGYRQVVRAAQGKPVNLSPVGAIKDMATEGAIGAGTEWVGQKMAAPVRRLLGGWYRGAMASSETAATRAAAEKYGMKMTAPEIAGKPGALSVRAANSGYFGLGRTITEGAQSDARKTAATAVETSLKKLDSTLTHPGTLHPPVAAGEASQAGLQMSHQVFKQEDNNLYRKVDQELAKLVKKVQVPNPPGPATGLFDVAGKPIPPRQTFSIKDQGLQVEMKPLRLYMDRVLKQIQEIAPTLQGLAGQDKSLISFANAIKNLPDAVSFENANVLRGNLLGELRKISDLLPGKFKGLEKTVEKLLDRQMEATASKGGAPVLAAWRRANQFHAAGARVFQDSIVADLVNKNISPENVFKKLGPDQVTDAHAIMEGFTKYLQYATPAEKVALNRTRNVFRQGYMSGMFKDAVAKLGQGESFDLKSVMTKNKPVLDVLLSGDPKAQAVRTDLNQLASFLNSQAPVKGMSHWALFEALAGAGTVLWGSHGGSAAVLSAAETGPWLLTKILYSKTATKFLLDGLVQLPKGTEAVGPALLRALRVAFADTGEGDEGSPQ